MLVNLSPTLRKMKVSKKRTVVLIDEGYQNMGDTKHMQFIYFIPIALVFSFLPLLFLRKSKSHTLYDHFIYGIFLILFPTAALSSLIVEIGPFSDPVSPEISKNYGYTTFALCFSFLILMRVLFLKKKWKTSTAIVALIGALLFTGAHQIKTNPSHKEHLTVEFSQAGQILKETDDIHLSIHSSHLLPIRVYIRREAVNIPLTNLYPPSYGVGRVMLHTALIWPGDNHLVLTLENGHCRADKISGSSAHKGLGFFFDMNDDCTKLLTKEENRQSYPFPDYHAGDYTLGIYTGTLFRNKNPIESARTQPYAIRHDTIPTYDRYAELVLLRHAPQAIAQNSDNLAFKSWVNEAIKEEIPARDFNQEFIGKPRFDTNGDKICLTLTGQHPFSGTYRSCVKRDEDQVGVPDYFSTIDIETNTIVIDDGFLPYDTLEDIARKIHRRTGNAFYTRLSSIERRGENNTLLIRFTNHPKYRTAGIALDHTGRLCEQKRFENQIVCEEN